MSRFYWEGAEFELVSRSRYVSRRWEAISKWHFSRTVGRFRRELLRIAYDLTSGRIPEKWIKYHHPWAKRHTRIPLQNPFRYPYLERIKKYRLVWRAKKVPGSPSPVMIAKSYYAGSVKAPRLPINRHTGQLQESLKIKEEKLGPLRSKFYLYTQDQHAFVLVSGGTRYMVDRYFFKEYDARTKGLFRRIALEIFKHRLPQR
ncbi:MAG: hypothetical protein RMJ43_03260 [Chloroherpetonaceae bacterium]|nr:hypothetical protein [Chloroherpetonaceae bacterium]